MSTFYIVATPIGNLEDITLRALRVLREADIILCEDTRETKKLLARHDILDKKLLAYNEQKSGASREKIVSLLGEGNNIALVTDAGTPAISDPGQALVSYIREKLNNEVKIEVIPGASALVSAISGSGVQADSFLFLGFLPHKKGRQTLFKEIVGTERTVIFYESPHRIMKTMESLKEYVPGRRVTLARELTKVYEEFISGTANELIENFNNHPEKMRGEFVVLVSPKV